MKKTYLICAVAAVLLLCAGIAVGMNINRQKAASEVPPAQEAAPEEIEQNGEEVQDDTEAVELSSAQPQQKQIEYFTAEDKEWIFQETYDNTQQLITSQGGSDAQSFEAELQDLPIYVDYFKNIFDGRVSPGINALREEYTAWRQANYGGDTAEAPKAAETPATTEVRQNQTNSNSDSNGSSGLTVEGITTTNPFAGRQDHHVTQEDIEATREAVEKAIEAGITFS